MMDTTTSRAEFEKWLKLKMPTTYKLAFEDGEWQADTGDVDDLKISHWMPLPAAPTSLLEGE